MIRLRRRRPGASKGDITDKQREVIERVAPTEIASGAAVCEGSLFLYAESEHGCRRYLVDRDGRVLDYEHFTRHPA